MIKVLTWYGVRDWKDFEYFQSGQTDTSQLRFSGIRGALYAGARSLLVRTCSEILAWYPSENPGIITITRKEEPLRGVRWNLGSGLEKGYTVEESIRRAAEKEGGLKLEDELVLLGPMMGFWEHGPMPSTPKGIQDFSLAVFGRAKKGQVKLDETSSDYHVLTEREFMKDRNTFHPYMQEFLPIAFDIGTGRLVIPEVGQQVTTQPKRVN